MSHFSAKGQSRAGALVLVMLIAGAVLLGLYLGRTVLPRGGAELLQGATSAADLQQSLKNKQAQLEMSSTRNEVDRQSLYLLHAELAEQKNAIAGLEEDLRFYRNLMAPESTEARFSLIAPDITPGAVSGQYSFRMVVLQRARKHEWAKGSLSIEVAGWGIDGVDSYSLSALKAEPNENMFELGFRYFQTIESELILPEGFQPSEVVVEVVLLKPNKLTLTELYPWPVEG